MLQIENESNLQEQKIIKDPLIEIKELPSGFKPYPKNSKVFYKPITLKELDILNSGSLNIEQGYQFLLDSIVTQGFDKNELAYFDVVYIGIQRKLTAFGDIKGKYELICPKCGQTIEYEFEYTSLEFKELQVDELPIKLKLNNEELHFSVLNIKDFLQIEDVEEAYFLTPVVKNVEKFLSKFERIQNGNIQQYILYGLIFLILMLIGLVFLG